MALIKYTQQEYKFLDTSKNLKIANRSAFKCNFFSLKFIIVSFYLVSAYTFVCELKHLKNVIRLCCYRATPISLYF